jgi:hypothetical protein
MVIQYLIQRTAVEKMLLSFYQKEVLCALHQSPFCQKSAPVSLLTFASGMVK